MDDEIDPIVLRDQRTHPPIVILIRRLFPSVLSVHSVAKRLFRES